MKGHYSLFLIVLFFGLSSATRWAQDTIDKELPTENINRRKDSNKRSNRSHNGIREIYKKNTWKTGYGNPCIEEATQKMEFIYAPVVKTQPGYTSEFRRNWHNLWVKAGLMVRRGPWWKLTIKKRIKDCLRKSGDMVGFNKLPATRSTA